MKIALGQINPTIGDFTGNSKKIIEFSRQALTLGAEMILFPELAVCGYPPRDLLEKPAFVERNQQVVNEIAQAVPQLTIICGFVSPAKVETGKSVMNSAAVLRQGAVQFVQSKMLLPTYDVFDELRYFDPAESQKLLPLAGKEFALTICEDAWNDKHFWHRRLYRVDPVDELLHAGGNMVLNISASPYHLGKRELRRQMLETIARDNKVPVLFVNQVGGNDSLIFDGSSMVIAPDGRIVAQAKSFEEDLVIFDSDTMRGDMHEQIAVGNASAYAALVLGTCDYVRKCGFSKVVIGLSGGIDSALTAAIAVDALGKENVTGIAMPSQYSSEHSIKDARELACKLGIRFEVIAIGEVFGGYRKALAPLFAGVPEDVAEENLQSRIRGNILMAFSNKFGALVLTTGNKSEVGVGYCTLYGDMVGGLGVISDVPKTMVYSLSRYVNSLKPVIPQSTIDKPPSAELRPGQKDSDTLPPYEVLDNILEDYVEDYRTAEQIAANHGYEVKLVRDVIRMIERSEYKRQQAAPGLKITRKAFGFGRRFPIAQKSEV
ncbi:MAG TPA: NAD+ synthase [Candidatus Polarisedimenticolia bacterium]|nr:NAD+ synthase [Candidatus Polarisedimenticolia bacterium]